MVQLVANPGVKDSNFESSQADHGAACHSCGWAGGYIDEPVHSGREDGGLRGRSKCAEQGVWANAPYDFALKGTQPGQPVKLFTTNNTDLGKSYLRTLHRPRHVGCGAQSRQVRETWRPVDATPPACSFRETSAPGGSAGAFGEGLPQAAAVGCF